MKRILRSLFASLLCDDLLLRIICFLGGVLFGGFGVAMSVFGATHDLGPPLLFRVFYWTIAILFAAYGALMFSRCVLSAKSRMARFLRRFLPDAVDLEAGALLILLVYLPAVLLTLLLRFLGVRGQHIDRDREFSLMTFEEAHRYIKRGDVVSLRRAIESGLDPNLSNRFSWTLLMLAALQGNPAIGKLLVSGGAKINATNDFGETPLSLAVCKGHLTFARWLLNAGASKLCRPHGSDLIDWIKQSYGLPPQKMIAALALLGDRQSRH